jgi:hypothetical protein
MVRAAGAQAPHLLHKVGGCLEQGGHLGRGGAGLEGDVEGDEAQAQQQGAGGGCAHGARNPNLVQQGKALVLGHAVLPHQSLEQLVVCGQGGGAAGVVHR